jgi:hypothetical protein
MESGKQKREDPKKNEKPECPLYTDCAHIAVIVCADVLKIACF